MGRSIKAAIPDTDSAGSKPVLRPTVADCEIRQIVVYPLYHARWDGHRYDDEPDAAEVLQNFRCCWNLLGCSYEEALEAWDRYLG